MEMAEVIEHLHDMLEREFPGAQISLDQASPSDRVGGLLVWDGFDQMEQIDRQRLVAKKIRENLPREEQMRVTAILTMTTAETAVPDDR